MSGSQLQRDEVLVRYLLGSLPHEEAERLDELSIADDTVASRLSEAENDLVDAYIRNELSGETLELFRSVYLASPGRRQKVQFAKTLAAFSEREQPLAHRWWAISTSIPRWSLATMAVAVALGATWFIQDDLRLRNQMSRSEAAAAATERRAQDLRHELDQLRASGPQPPTDPAPLTTLAVLLGPPTRGAARIPTVTIAARTGAVAFELQLEANDFPSYRAALNVSEVNRTPWRSGVLKAHASGERSAISVTLPASLLGPGNNVFEVSGLGPDLEPIGSYAFRVTVK
jgi:hypothetical protein